MRNLIKIEENEENIYIFSFAGYTNALCCCIKSESAEYSASR